MQIVNELNIFYLPEGKEVPMRELLSLIIPCYNEEKTLDNCIERCLALKEHGVDVELIIVDDCSTDGSYRVAQELASR